MTKNTKRLRLGLHQLSSLLRNSLGQFETVAEEINDAKIKMALRGLAVETRQYEHELNSQLRCLRIREMDQPESSQHRTENTHHVAEPSSNKPISEVCRISEDSFDEAYLKVLNEYLLQEDLRSMLIYQRNNIKSSFTKIKLLNLVQ